MMHEQRSTNEHGYISKHTARSCAADNNDDIILLRMRTSTILFWIVN
jgi:hypothetical protein